MNLTAVMDQVADALRTVTGFKFVHAFPPPSVVPPVGIVSYPEKIEYDQTHGRGMDRIRNLPVVVVVGKATDRAARDRVAAWSTPVGEGSIKQGLESAFERGALPAIQYLSVLSCDFDVVTIAGVDYLAAMFAVDIAGSGLE